MAQPAQLPYCGKIRDFVRKSIRDGLSRRQIFDAVQRYQNAPRSMTTFYKLYRADMDEVHADIVGQVGAKVVQQALDGDFKSQDLFLRSKGGWSPSSTEQIVVDEEEQDTSALDKLMKLLGKG